METKYNLNEVPSTTWNWLKSNKDTITLNTEFSVYEPELKNLPQGITIGSSKNILLDLPQISSGIFNISTPKAKDKRASDGTTISADSTKNYFPLTNSNHALQKLVNEVCPDSQFITVSEKISKPIILNFELQKASVSKQLIYAKENSEATIIFVFKGDSPSSIVQTKVYAAENAKIHIIKVQLMGKSSLLLDDTDYNCADNAEARFTQIELGGLHLDSGVHTTLKGYQSKFYSNVAYLVQDQQYLDFNHIVYHYGKKTECDMQVNGTLKDKAAKVYRGTIDFKNGCSGAKGNEMEESLVLSPLTVNKSLPVILCDEEDVEGEHGSTIGRLSSEILFYMQSRGISEEQAEKIMSRAKIQAVAAQIPDQQIIEDINKFLGEED